LTALSPVHYRVRPLPADVAAEVRATGRSPDYGHPVHAEVADGRAPCRVCFEKFVPGIDRRLLLTYDPFREAAPGRPLPGPVFVHAEHCAPAVGEKLPESFAGDRLTLTAYGDDRTVVGEVRTADPREAADAVELLFCNERTRYVHVRSTPNGCFLCQLDPIVV
jgi:Protein of unknown function (DUF1203)